MSGSASITQFKLQLASNIFFFLSQLLWVILQSRLVVLGTVILLASLVYPLFQKLTTIDQVVFPTQTHIAITSNASEYQYATTQELETEYAHLETVVQSAPSAAVLHNLVIIGEMLGKETTSHYKEQLQNINPTDTVFTESAVN